MLNRVHTRQSVTEEEVVRFQEQGFLSWGAITDEEELEWLRSLYDDLFRERSGERDGLYFDLAGSRGHDGRDVLPQILMPEQMVPELLETRFRRNARQIAARLLNVPEEELTDGGHMILKPPHYGHETPWHQDEAYWDPHVLPRSVSAWMPLDAATVESGCMHFIPGSHRKGIVPHRHIGNDPTVHGLVTDHVNTRHAIACPLSPGGATFHHCRTLHYAGPNRTEHPRRAYILVLNAPPQRPDVPDHRPWLDEERRALEALQHEEPSS